MRFAEIGGEKAVLLSWVVIKLHSRVYSDWIRHFENPTQEMSTIHWAMVRFAEIGAEKAVLLSWVATKLHSRVYGLANYT